MEDFKTGDKVHVEFDGTVYDYGTERLRGKVSTAHVPVTSDGYIHHIHRNSSDITKIAPPQPEVKLGQVWRADGRNFLAYHDSDSMDGIWFAGTTPAGKNLVEIITGAERFFKTYPDAKLILEADGYVI